MKAFNINFIIYPNTKEAGVVTVAEPCFNKNIKSINPVAKSRTTGEHGPAAISIVHKNKKKYSRKSKHKKIKFS